MKTSVWTNTPFEGLREALKDSVESKAKRQPPSADRKHLPKENVVETGKNDEELFREAMADVREIKEFRSIPFVQGVVKPCSSRRDDAFFVLREVVEGKRKIRLSDTGEYMEWVCPDLPKDLLRRLHEGSYAVQDSIDLHGMTLEEADEAIVSFFREALRKKKLCIKVIHGRGLRSPNGPVLKDALKRWLEGKLRKKVAAFVTARDCDGGLGATYILLKPGN